MKTKPDNTKIIRDNLIADIRMLIDKSKQQMAVAVNSAMSMLYWQIGKRINEEIEGQNRADTYGKEIVATLWKKLSEEYGASFSEKNMRRMMQFAKVFPDEKIVVSLIRKLTWTHILAIIPIEDALKRDFYIEMCYHEKWSVRTFRNRIDSMLYERTAISKKPEETIKSDLQKLKDQQKLSPDLVFRDPYFLDFLGLRDKYSEKDLEAAIITELESFIIEMGSDFAFVARQKRLTVDDEDYYIDLLFYHRKLKSLVAIDLKLGRFQAAYKGQMELYLRWLDKNLRNDGENQPVGLILCAGKSSEHIELLQLENSNIKVADYLTQLPAKHLLEQKLRSAIEIAKNKLIEKKLKGNPMTTQTVKLGDVCEIFIGGDAGKYDTTKEKDDSHSIPVYSNGIVDDGLYGFTNKSEVKAGAITISARGTVGFIKLRETDFVPIVRLIAVIPGPEKVNSKYLEAFLQMQTIYATGSSQQQITAPMIKNLTLILPPLAEQRRVAGILGSLDEKIENNRRLIRTAEALARTLFKKHIVSNEESEGWENTTLGDKIHPKRGKNITRNEAREGNIPVVAGGLEPSCYHDTSNTIAPVITISSSGANAGFVRLWNENVWSTDSSFIDKTITENIYFYYVLLSINQDILYGKQTGTGQPHIYPSHIESIKMPNVPDETISAFNAAVEPLFAEIGFLTGENQTLAATRDKLLRKLIK